MFREFRIAMRLRSLAFVLLCAVAILSGCAGHLKTYPKDPPDLGALLQQAALGTPEDRPTLNLGTGVPLVFTETSRGFAVATLGKDSLLFDGRGFTLALAEATGAPAAFLHAEIDFVGTGEPPRGAEPALSIANRLVGPNPRSWQTGTPTFSAIRYTAVQRGIDLVFTANSRALRSSYRVAAGADPASIRIRLPGLRQTAPDPVTGRLRLLIADDSDRARALTLLPPRVTQGDRTLSAHYVVEGSTVGLAIEQPNRAAELRADFELVYGDISHDYDARTDSGGSSVVVRSVASTDGPERNDILLARLDAAGRLLSTTIVGGSGDDVPLGVAIAPDGSLYITGKTNSHDFPLVQPVQRERQGGYDAFLLKLDRSGQRLLASTYLGGSGDDAGEAIVLGGARGAFVAGRGWLDCAAPRVGRVSFATLFPKPNEGDQNDEYFLAHLPLKLDRLVTVERFTAPLLPGRVSVWLNPVGIPVLGVFYLPPPSCKPGTDQTYTMSHLGDSAFDQDKYVNHATAGSTLSPFDTGWGYHALRWKAIGDPSMTYQAAAATNIPLLSVHCNFDEDHLNLTQLSSLVFLPPPGPSWQCYPHLTEEGLGLAAAFYMHRFKSPVYTGIRWWESLHIPPLWQYYALGIEQVTFCAIGPATLQPLHTMCNFDNIDATMINDYCVFASGGHYLLKDIKGRTWGETALVYYAPSVTLQPDYSQSYYNKWYYSGDYIADPPLDQAPLLPYIDDAILQLTGLMLTERELEVTIHPVLGSPRAATFSGLVRALDLVSTEQPR